MTSSFKRSMLLIFVLLCVLLCACGIKEEPQPTPVPTPTPAPEIPGLRDYNKALSYYNADGVERNFEKALEYFLESANAEYVPAMEKLAYMHEMGLGTPSNPETAGLWFSVAAQKGSSIAKLYIDGVGHLDEEAVHALLPADAVEEYELGMECYYGIGAKQDFAAAFSHFENSAELGCGRGCYGLAVCYLRGSGVAQDYEKAGEYFEKALELGCIDAADRLIYLHSGQYGAPANEELELKWRERRLEILTTAAERGYKAYALESAETALDDGLDAVAQEWYKACFEPYEAACEEGDSEAQFAMAVYYMTKDAFLLPEPEAEEADAAQTDAQPEEPDRIDFIPAPVETVNPELEEALRLIELSAAQGNPYAKHIKWCEELRDEEYMLQLAQDMLQRDPSYVYSLNMHYWLCYRDEAGSTKLRIVYIPACSSGETTEVIDRITNESLYELRLYRRQYVDELDKCITREFSPMHQTELIGLFPLASCIDMFDAAGISELFSIYNRYGEFSDFMYGNHPKPGSLISLEELCRMYLMLVPIDYRV